MRTPFQLLLIALLFSPQFAPVLTAQRLVIPRRQEKPPGPPQTPQEAIAKMTVPDGFSVELVAAEPQLMNPVAMAIDEKGRFWVTESFEYPRKEPGPGRDRIKVLEDTDDDGRVDKVTVFAEGLNIPSGIAVGHGGVWVANAPDLLFLQDTDGDLVADRTEKVLTGFGRTDTHELPNSFTWGPDGWLYGLNGVFNYCDVHYTEENPNYSSEHPGWEFTCALWRLHPRTREFQIFAEGTSNPWGIATNPDGEFFLSACVIDHLWHITEDAYYIRQGGPYPPHTWPLRSIVDHKHQLAAYCGIVYFDSDVYPPEYNECLYMGNIHGGCINTDVIEPRGASYWGKPRPDFLTANDPWFMPVVQAIGPDGNLYILDWYDRYHCYQDANADPEGIDRGHGRLYRVRYQDSPRAKDFDLSKLDDAALIAKLGSGNAFIRFTAGRLLAERANHETADRLIELVLQADAPLKKRLHALWARAALGPLQDRDWQSLLEGGSGLPDEIRVWVVRLGGDQRADSQSWAKTLKSLAVSEESSRVRLSLLPAIAKSQRLSPADKAELLCILVQRSDFDPTIAHVGYQTLVDLFDQTPSGVLAAVQSRLVPHTSSSIRDEMLFRITRLAIDQSDSDSASVARFISAVLSSDLERPKQVALAEQVSQRMRRATEATELTAALREELKQAAGKSEFATFPFLLMRSSWGDSAATTQLASLAAGKDQPDRHRIAAFEVVAGQATDAALRIGEQILAEPNDSEEVRAGVISVLSRLRDDKVADVLLNRIGSSDAGLRPKLVEALTQRPEWTAKLLQAIEAEQVDRRLINRNQLIRIATFEDRELQELVSRVLGSIRTEPSNRTRIIRTMNDRLRSTPGNPKQGRLVFDRVCGQCHQIYGKGAEVGPDITRNGRSNWDQLLHNVFDPSAVIGPGYQARLLLTTDGRTLTGIPVEENEDRVVLTIQGGKQETVPREEIEIYRTSPVSMMPEDLEKQVSAEELADLFAFLALDGPPEDADAKLISGTPRQLIAEGE